MSSSSAMLWSGLAIPPLAWFISLEVNFAAAPLACSGRGKLILYSASAVALLLAILGGVLASTQHAQLARGGAGERAEVQARRKAMAFAGIALSVLSGLAIFAQLIP